MKNNTLPASWELVRFGDVAYIKNGFAFPSKDFLTSGVVPLIKQSQLDGDTVRLDKCVYLDERVLESHKSFVLQKGDVLIGMSGSIGKLCIYDLDKPAMQNQRTGKVVARNLEVIDKEIFWLYLQTIENQLKKKGKGIGVANVSGGDIEDLPFALPPLAEQRRIVAQLNATMQRLKDSQERIEKLPELLKKFRQAVLAAAVLGKLTEAWRAEHSKTEISKSIQGIANYIEFNSSSTDIPASWFRTSLGALVQAGPQNGLYKPQTDYGTGSIILRIDNFYEGAVNAWNTLKRVRVDDKEASLYGLNNDDIVINRVNSMSHLGKSALIRSLPEPCVFESNMMRITLNRGLAEPEFIIHFLSSVIGLAELRKNAKQAVNQASINQTDVKGVAVSLPPLIEQQEIVRQVNHYFSLADQLETRFDLAAAMVEQLPQALLAKAFSGQLVPQDPNDEPASALLERLRAPQATSEAPTKSKPGRKPKAPAQAPLFD